MASATLECRICGDRVTAKNARLHVEELLVDARRAYAAEQENLARELRAHAAAIRERFFHVGPRHGDLGSDKDLPLSTIRILFREPDSLTLWGIPYDMRPGQQPGDLLRAYRSWSPPRPGHYGSHRIKLDDWVYLGGPGWFGNMSAKRKAEVQAFLAKYKEYVPGNSYEWDRLPLPDEARPTHGDRRAGRAYVVERLSGRRVAVVPAFSSQQAVLSVSRSRGISKELLRGRQLR
jgi:hypothetical protein